MTFLGGIFRLEGEGAVMRLRLLSLRPVVLASVLAVVATLSVPIPGSAAVTDSRTVVINEMMYHALSDLDGDDFLELHNPGTTAVDLSGWTFSGVTLVLPAGTSIAPGGFLVVAKDAARFQATYGFTPAAVYTGNLSNSSDAVVLKDAGGATIDSVTYVTEEPWPVTPDGTGPSLERIDPTLDGNDSLNWAASTAGPLHTVRAANSVRGSGLGPRITNVTASPNAPAVNQAVTVTATVTGQTAAPTLFHRTDFAAEQSQPMTSAGGGSWTATIPGAAAGHLIRYRIHATNAARGSRVPRIDDSQIYKGVVVQSGLSSAIPVLEWFILPADYSAITNSPTVDIVRPAVLAYNGTVFDNIMVNIRGQGSQTAPKPNWKIELPKNYPISLPGLIEPVDEFAMQADWSDRAHGRALLAWESYRIAGNVNAQVFPVRTQRNSAFQGLYTYVDLFDGTWREREGYDGAEQFYKAGHGAFDASRPLEEYRFEKKNPADGDFAPIRAFLDGVDLTGTAQRNFLLGNADIPQMINYAAVTAIVAHHDSSSKNFYLSRDDASGRWKIIPWDLDHTYGNGCCNVNSNFVTPAEPGDQVSELMAGILAVPAWRDMYFRRLRTLVNEILAPGRLEAVYNDEVGPAQPEATLDFAAWPYPAGQSFTQQRTNLFNAIQARRNAFANDARVPGNQPAAPDIVINEIQHSPVAGNGAEFLELYNPATTAIDLSGWKIQDGIGLNIQPGTVILPGGTMTFVSSDPTFRSMYGASVFVGGRFSGDLGGSETLTLLRADGSTSDTVTYGGAGWPTVTDGRSFELLDAASDNNDPVNWAPSQAAGGSPGAANGDAVVTAPDAPTIGTASAGNASATVNWTPPANNGGANITGYDVRVLNNAGAQVGALRPAVAGATSLVVNGLSNGTSYRFQVQATNSAGTSPLSALSNSVTPSAGATAPGPPVIGAPSQGAAGGSLTAIARWTPPASTGGSPITGYRVTALRMSSAAADAAVLGSTVSRVLRQGIRQFTFTLNAGNYRFTVVAINAIGTGPSSARSANVVPR